MLNFTYAVDPKNDCLMSYPLYVFTCVEYICMFFPCTNLPLLVYGIGKHAISKYTNLIFLSAFPFFHPENCCLKQVSLLGFRYMSLMVHHRSQILSLMQFV